MERSILKTLVASGLVLAFSSCGGKTELGVNDTAPAQVPTSQEVNCPGLPARAETSSSYLPDAPSITDDGDEIELRLQVVDPTATGCKPAAGVRVEIWHTGTDGYQPDKWRTSLVTDDDGYVNYRTVRPEDSEGFPHYHLRVVRNNAVYEWVLGLDRVDVSEMNVSLILSYMPPPATPGTPADAPQV